MNTYFPSPWTVVHFPRPVDGATDSHGNAQPDTGDPVVRQAQSVTQFGRRGSSRQIFSTETLGREEVMLHLAVADPTPYHSGDQVILGAELDSDGSYIPGSGMAYVVDGDPSDERQGPWQRYTALFGGEVKLRRTT